jgi:hypothetical protein
MARNVFGVCARSVTPVVKNGGGPNRSRGCWVGAVREPEGKFANQGDPDVIERHARLGAEGESDVDEVVPDTVVCSPA